jgi:hypothetical protein
MSKSDKVQLAVIYGLAIILGAISIVYGNNTINAIQVEPPSQVKELETGNTSAPGRTLSTYDVQGGYRQTVQVTAVNDITPQPAAHSLGDPESTDLLQPTSKVQ